MASNEARLPNIEVLANGTALNGVLHAQIQSCSHFAADRFQVKVSLSATGYDIWSVSPIQIEIRVGLNDSWASIITGRVDRLEIDAARQELYAEGRDLTSLFIAARTQENFDNNTASDIATILAGRQGLTAQVTPTTTLVGRNFQNDHSRTSLDQYSKSTTQWDLLTKLAELESFDVWVSGQTLNFAPIDQNSDPITLAPTDCISLAMERDLQLDTGLAIAVKSWDCRGQQAIFQQAGTASGSDGSADYIIVRPNLTADAAQALAQRMLVEMSQQSRVISLEMPGDLTTMPRGLLNLVNTQTDFDGVYLITDVERSISFHHGYTQTLQARVPPWIISSTN